MKPESASKTKLLETAIDMIWASSYGSVSVDDICAKAGVNKGSFYYAFKSKSDLAVAAFERHWELEAAAPGPDLFAPASPAGTAGAILPRHHRRPEAEVPALRQDAGLPLLLDRFGAGHAG